MGALFSNYTAYEFLWFFILYAFLGWCVEVAYAAMCQGKFVNRGFLNGPYCPIYGFGVVLVVGLLSPLAENGPLLFLGSVILTSALEWSAGFVLEKVFHNKWWDYSDVPFNLNGYICLKFSVLWGLACMFIVDIFHPTIVAAVSWIPHPVGWVLVALLLMAFAADTCVTAMAVLKLNRRLEHMEEIAEKLKETSDRIGEEISDNVLELMEKQEEFREKTEEFRERTEELKEKAEGLKEKAEELQRWRSEKRAQLQLQRQHLKEEYAELAGRRTYVHDRLMRAYPSMRSNRYRKALEDVRKSLHGVFTSLEDFFTPEENDDAM